jgi:hypothetical protein
MGTDTQTELVCGSLAHAVTAVQATSNGDIAQ